MYQFYSYLKVKNDQKIKKKNKFNWINNIFVVKHFNYNSKIEIRIFPIKSEGKNKEMYAQY